MAERMETLKDGSEDFPEELEREWDTSEFTDLLNILEPRFSLTIMQTIARIVLLRNISFTKDKSPIKNNIQVSNSLVFHLYGLTNW